MTYRPVPFRIKCHFALNRQSLHNAEHLILIKRSINMKIHTYGTLTPNEDSTITTTAITQHNSLLQEELNVHLPLMAVNKLPHLTVRKLQQQQKKKKKEKKKWGDLTLQAGVVWHDYRFTAKFT